MRKIITTTFVSLDGVMQAPGGPEEDPTGGFKYGGWTFNYWDEIMGNYMDDLIAKPFDLLLGRITYEIFAAYWPFIKSGSPDGAIADKFNKTTKYVVSTKPLEITWQNTILITGDITAELKKLKTKSGNDLWVHGSGNLIQTLLANNLIDRSYVWIFPVTIGKGKELFAEGTQAQGLKLIETKTAASGVIIACYEPAGELKTGTFATTKPTAAELTRRKRIALES